MIRSFIDSGADGDARYGPFGNKHRSTSSGLGFCIRLDVTLVWCSCSTQVLIPTPRILRGIRALDPVWCLNMRAAGFDALDESSRDEKDADRYLEPRHIWADKKEVNDYIIDFNHIICSNR